MRKKLRCLSSVGLLSILLWSCTKTSDGDKAGPSGQDFSSEVPINFSFVGYRYGIKDIPQVAVKVTLDPPATGVDATRMIQEALDNVQAPGAVLLNSGEYLVGTSLTISQSGVVLRGKGESTIIKATGTEQRSLINLGESTRRTYGASSDIVENAPVGQMWVKVQTASTFKEKDRVVVYLKPNEKWVDDLKMNQIPGTSVTQWTPDDYEMFWEREVRAVNDDKVWLDCPLVYALDSKYAAEMSLRKISRERVQECGVEDLYLVTEYDPDVVDKDGNRVDENHAWTAIEVQSAENCWIRNIKSAHFGLSLVELGNGARCVTVENCRSTRPVSKIEGSRRYAFHISKGELCLVKNCFAEHDRHGFVTAKLTPGPNVFLDCSMTNAYAGVGPHQRWASGVLYDCCQADERLEVEDRGDWGTGHGWAGVNFVLWNCSAQSVVCQSPWICGQNWCIGALGTKDAGRYDDRPDGMWISHGKHVEPASLYRHQLEIRKKAYSQYD